MKFVPFSCILDYILTMFSRPLTNIRFAFLVGALLLFIGDLYSQTTLGIEEEKINSSGHKVLVLPFGDKMYMSQIDHVIATETKLKQGQIRYAFQDALDEELYKKMKSKFGVVSLFADTAKYKKELGMVFSGIRYNYDKIPSQTNYITPTSDYNREAQLKNGNIETEVNNEARFMNAKISNKQLLSSLNKKLGTDLFVFINELDLKAPTTDPADFGEIKMRLAVLHYTCFNLQGQEINSGVVNVNFPKNINDPKKIVSVYLTQGVDVIVKRLEKAVQPGKNQGKK